MKKLFSMVAIALLVASCGGGDGGGGGDVDTDVCGGTGLGCITGSVTDSTGTAIANPTVTWVGASNINTSVNASLGNKAITGTDIATGNEQGWFTADSIGTGDQVVCFSATGYVPVCRTLTIVEALTTPVPDVPLPTRGAAITVTNAQNAGATATDGTTGASITFNDNNSVCDSSGTAVTGDITCYLTPLDAMADLQQVPDTFQAVSAAGDRGTMVSSAIMSVECELGGNALQICSGTTANVVLPKVNNCNDLTDNPATLDGWRYDESTGLWSEYPADCTKACGGTATTDVYDCRINHMTWVNGDKWRDDVCITGTVVGSPGGTGQGRAWVECWGGGWRNTAYTNESGQFCVPVPSNYSYTCRVCDTIRCNDTADNITGTATGTIVEFPISCPDDRCTDVGQFIFAQPRVNTTLTWGASPSDLDSHFVSEGGSTHVYYADKDVDLLADLSKGSLTMAPYVQLDTDDTSSYGPEVTSVMPDIADGTYRFCVRNFTGETGGGLCDSTAKVRVEIPSQGGDSVNVAQTRTVPTSCPSGNNLLWQVYEVQITGGVATNYRTLDNIVDSSSPTAVPTECFED